MGTHKNIFGKVLAVAVVVISLAACGSGGSESGTGSAFNSSNPANSNDRLEPGLQGQIPLSEQINGSAAAGYRKGLRLVGQNTILNRGANFSMAWVGDCAYVTTTSGQQLFGLSNTPYALPADFMLNGMAVIDASNPTDPELIQIIRSPVMLRTHESLQANEARRIIVATSSLGNQMEVYDATDCRNPVLRSTLEIGTGIDLPLPALADAINTELGGQFGGHALCMAPDGMTAYATGVPISNAAIDLSDLDNPKVIEIFTPAAHDCGVSRDGNRLYLAGFGGLLFGATGGALSILTGSLSGLLETLGNLSGNGDVAGLLDAFTGGTNLTGGEEQLGTEGFNGLLIVDVSEIQSGAAEPELRAVSSLAYTPQAEGESPFAGSHTARMFRNNGREYVYSSDEWPIAGELGACPWAHGRIIDITDEANPVEVADIELEVTDLANCPQTTLDLANYSSHYVGFDNVDDARLLFTTWYSAGLRVWDIRDPANPQEIAYFHPSPDVQTALAPSTFAFGGNNSLVDTVPSYVRFRPESGHIWITSALAGFQILEFTESAGVSDR